MSRGVGRLQRRILEELAKPSEPAYRFAVDIANALFPPQASRSALVSVRKALASLAKRRLIWSRFEATDSDRGIVSGLPWARMLPWHNAQPTIGAPCRCCPGGQDAFRATLDHAGARRLLGLPPQAAEAASPNGDLPPAGAQRTKIPIDALGNQLIVAMKVASRATGPDAPRGSPYDHLALSVGDEAIRAGWIPRAWATERIRQMLQRQYDVSGTHAHQLAGRVLRHLEAVGLIEFGSTEPDRGDGVLRGPVFVRLLDNSCLGSEPTSKANDTKDEPAPKAETALTAETAPASSATPLSAQG